MERKVGEIFEYNGEWYQCIHTKSLGCENCDLATKSDIHCSDVFEIRGECLSCYRKDGKSVIFKKLEKVGEPYMSNGHLMQTLSGEKQPNSIRDYKTRMCYYANCILRIEIKQNKEDMEEKKLSLKPFDLEAAKAGKPVCTRDGRKARIICWDKKGNYPIVALIQDNENSEHIEYYTENGIFSNGGNEKNRDLMMFTRKKEGWLNIYKDFEDTVCCVYPTEKEALEDGETEKDYITTIKIEWEE